MATLADFDLPANFDQKGGFATEQTLMELKDSINKFERTK